MPLRKDIKTVLFERSECRTICELDTTVASAMAMGSSPLSPIMVTSSTRRSKRSASAVSASVSNSVPCCRIFVNTSMKAARVWGSLWYPNAETDGYYVNIARTWMNECLMTSRHNAETDAYYVNIAHNECLFNDIPAQS